MADFITDRNNDKKLLRVFTLNCWSIPYFSENRKSRITAIAEYLSTSNLDIVCLQEVWSKKDYLFISKKCYTQLPYSHYFNSFIYGSGLCILSKYPITDVYFHQWAINGYPHKILQGDWFAGKGLAFSKIVMNDFIIHIYNAHLHAEYNANSVDYLSHRVLQALDTSQFIKFTTEDCDLAILAGDLNTEPNELPMKILNQNAQLADCFYTAQEKCSSAFGTNESERNSYSPKAKVKNHPEGKRIDYVLYRNSKRLNVDVTQYNFPLPEYVPGCKHSYSDHEAIEVVFQCIVDSGLKAKTPEIDAFELQTTLETSIEICNEALNKLQVTRKTYFSFSVIFALLLTISLFAELFFHIPLDFGVAHVTFIILFNLVKVSLTLGFIFFTVMNYLWSKSEKSAILTGKFSLMTILKRLKKL